MKKEIWKRVKDSPTLQDQLQAAEVDRAVLETRRKTFKGKLEEIEEIRRGLYAERNEVSVDISKAKKRIDVLKNKIEDENYIYNPKNLVIGTDPGDFIPCEYKKYDPDRWLTGSLRGYSPESSAPYKIANKPSSRWAGQVRIKKEDWADYVNRIAPSMMRMWDPVRIEKEDNDNVNLLEKIENDLYIKFNIPRPGKVVTLPSSLNYILEYLDQYDWRAKRNDGISPEAKLDNDLWSTLGYVSKILYKKFNIPPLDVASGIQGLEHAAEYIRDEVKDRRRW